MRAIPVSDSIHWVGAVDWNLRDFHGYETPRGTTYNAYLVQGADTIALVDTVKAPFVDELLSRIADVVDPAKVGLIVVNHVEPDHNGGLPAVMAAMPNARVVASAAGVKGIAEYHGGLVVDAVGADDVIDLGGRTLRFLPASMVHWPDSMFTYCPEVTTLMPNDAFGQHMASAERFADEVGVPLALEELGIYFANILMALDTPIEKAIAKLGESGWAPTVIAPSHGVIWRGEALAAALKSYERWTSNTLRDKVVVAYGTMWGSTDALARRIADGVAAEGVEVSLYDLAVSPISTITHDLLEAKGLLLGSSTLHRAMIFRVAGYLQWIAGLKPTGRLGGAFGSYGWSSGAVEQITARMTEIGFQMVGEPYKQKYRPTDEELMAAYQWGREFARAVKGA
jgi:anaerobic nitric oxide reductase flavorubredoxin